MEIRTLNNANEWLKLHNINSFIHDDSVYIVAGDSFEFELSKEEAQWRAQLFVDYNNNK